MGIKNSQLTKVLEIFTMENIEITVKVNDEPVDLSTISTETFERIKKAETEIPTVRTADLNVGYINEDKKRLILNLPNGILSSYYQDKVVALENGKIANCWDRNITADRHNMRSTYKNVRVVKY